MLPSAVFVSDLDGTLTFFPGPPGPFLGDLTPVEATSPLTRFTQKLTRTLLESHVPAMIVSKNSSKNIDRFIQWSGAKLDPEWADLTASTQDKLDQYRLILDNLPPETLVIFAEDSMTLIPSLLLLAPERMVVVPAKEMNLPQQFEQFLGSDNPDKITDELWIQFLTQKWKDWNPEPWIRLREVLDLIPNSTLKVGPKFLNIEHKSKKLFRISRSNLNIYTPTGKASKGNLMDSNWKNLWGFRV